MNWLIRGFLIAALAAGCDYRVDNEVVISKENYSLTKSTPGSTGLVSDRCWLECVPPCVETKTDCLNDCFAHAGGTGKGECIRLCNEQGAYCESRCKTECTLPEDIYWSNSGRIPGKICKPFRDFPQDDVDGWDNNFLCSDNNYGLLPLSENRIMGKFCTSIFEHADPDWKTENYLCHSSANIYFKWSEAGPIPGMPKCLRIDEPEDTHAWGDNYLCWDVVYSP